jgi:hypothetical protein
MSPHKTIEMLRIKSCSDPQRWYAKLVGQKVPRLGYDPISGWKSKEPAGYTNFVLPQDAERIAVFVPEHMLGRWPYITHRTLEEQTAQAVAKLAATLPPKTCAAMCDRLGVCQSLGDCKDQAQIDTQPVKTAPTGQSRTHSMAEASANLVIGFVGSLLVTAYLLPHIGIQISTQQNFGMTAIFTVLSLLRAYFVRRLFNRLHSQKGA